MANALSESDTSALTCLSLRVWLIVLWTSTCPLELQKMCPPSLRKWLNSLMHKDSTRPSMLVEACSDRSWFTPWCWLCLSHSGRSSQCWLFVISASCQGRSRETAGSAAMLRGTPRGIPAATGLNSKSPSAPLSPSFSSYVKQVISPISSQAPSLFISESFVTLHHSCWVSLMYLQSRGAVGIFIRRVGCSLHFIV